MPEIWICNILLWLKYAEAGQNVPKSKRPQVKTSPILVKTSPILVKTSPVKISIDKDISTMYKQG